MKKLEHWVIDVDEDDNPTITQRNIKKIVESINELIDILGVETIPED